MSTSAMQGGHNKMQYCSVVTSYSDSNVSLSAPVLTSIPSSFAVSDVNYHEHSQTSQVQ